VWTFANTTLTNRRTQRVRAATGGGDIPRGRQPASGCGSTETLTTGGSFQITDGQDVIFGSGEPTTNGYYFVYALYSP
jgi:hypothetical protein